MSKHGIHLLTAKECDRLVREGSKARHRDGGSLFLEVNESGRASWVYRWGTNNNPYHIGTYADFSLIEARTEKAKAKEWVRQGLNPSQQRKLEKASNAANTAKTFYELANQWLDSMQPNWSDKHYIKSKQAIERDAFPALGSHPAALITPSMVHEALEPLHKRAPETWTRVRQHIGLIFDQARIEGLRNDNPVIKTTGGTRSSGKRNARQPALIKITELGKLLRKTEASNASPAVKTALWLLSRTAVRPGELVPAKWEEFDLDSHSPKWVIPRARMKTQSRENDHAIPLSPTVVHKLKWWQQITKNKGFVFSSSNHRNKTGYLSIESLEKCYRVTLGMKGKHVPHGWRSAFNSNAHDALDTHGKRLFDEDIVEIALDHTFASKVRQAYDRGERWEARQTLMQWWSDQLDKAEKGADILEFRHVR